MAPPKSTAEGWKHVEKLDGSGNRLKCKLCNLEFVGTLTRVMDHLLSITNGKGGGVVGCPGVSVELKKVLEKDYERIKKAKAVNENKKDALQERLQCLTTPFLHFLQIWLMLEVHVSQQNHLAQPH